jgi:hypothetical protein
VAPEPNGAGTTHDQAALRAGASVGYDWLEEQSVGIQLSLRLDLVRFADRGFSDDRQDGWNSGWWLSAGVGVVADL